MKATVGRRWDLELTPHRAEFHRAHPEWELRRIESLADHIHAGDVIVDVGAEVGDYAAIFASWGARTVLIEPQPKYWPHIKANFDLNALTPLRCFAGFASDATQLNLATDFQNGYRGVWPECAFGALDEKWAGFRNLLETAACTPQVRIDDLDIPAPSVLNIDVEGAELRVLHGAQSTLTDHRPIVFVSVHPAMMAHDYNIRPEDLFAFMAGFGYNAELLAEDHEQHYLFTP